MSLNGFDVSAYQPADITKNVAGDFVFIKLTEGTGYASGVAAQQYSAAVASGKLVGFYHFADGGHPKAEAAWFMQHFTPYLGKALPALDFEGGAVAHGSPWALAFLTAVHDAEHVKPVLYGSLSVVQQATYATIHAAGFQVWEAAYGADTPTVGYHPPAQGVVGAWPHPILRQYTSTMHLPGYGGNLDGDVFYGTKADWKNATKIENAKPAKPPVKTPTHPAVKPAPAKPTLKQGDTGAEVKTLQEDLNKHGAHLAVDGVFGPLTDAAVKAFQTTEKIAVDGVVGPVTWGKLA